MSGSREDWQTFKVGLKSAPPETAFVLLRVMGERLSLEVDPELAIEDASDGDGLIVAGAALMVRATRVRGMDTAERVDDHNWVPYFANRERAEQILRAAVRLRPESGLGAAWFSATAIDSDDEVKSEAAKVLGQASDVPISGYSKLLSANTEKWGGSHQAMWQVARAYASVRPPWTSALVAKAHYEQWLYLELMDDRPEAAKEAELYFREPAIRDELTQISRATSDAASADPYETVYAHDVLAAVLAQASMAKAAAAHLRQVGSFGDPALLTGGPWWQRALGRISSGLPLW
ncbi:MAG: hypothetical protein ABIO43_03510 [Sphingomicrobium sp.]